MIPLLLPGFEFSEGTIDADTWPDAFHHLTRVLRAKAGNTLSIANGAGQRCDVTIESIQKSSITLAKATVCKIVERPRVTLWIAVIDKSAMEEACHLVSQVGVAAIRFVQTDFTNAQWQERHTARLQKIIMTSCIQSEQAWLPELTTQAVKIPSLPWEEDSWHVAIERQETGGEVEQIAVAETEVSGCATTVSSSPIQNVLIGPEGGWSKEEREYFHSQMQDTPKTVCTLDLGRSILRAQTAALVACWSFTRQV